TEEARFCLRRTTATGNAVKARSGTWRGPVAAMTRKAATSKQGWGRNIPCLDAFFFQGSLSGRGGAAKATWHRAYRKRAALARRYARLRYATVVESLDLLGGTRVELV